MKIAASAYQAGWHPDPDAMMRKLDAWVAEAVSEGADLLVFPEYAGIEIALIGQPSEMVEPLAWVARMVDGAGSYAQMIGTLAQRHRVHILAGSLCADNGGKTVNRAHLLSPNGQIAVQDKLIPTPYERTRMGIVGGDGLHLIETDLGRIGVLICYDSEFPLLARQLVEAGADMILVPSCTDQPAGQTRVRQSARARAIEGQCLIIQSPLVGPVLGCDIVDVSTGRAGIFCPPDFGLPPRGVIAEGDTDVPGWTMANVDPARVAAPRASGQVGNFAHWPEQKRHVIPVTTTRLD